MSAMKKAMRSLRDIIGNSKSRVILYEIKDQPLGC